MPDRRDALMPKGIPKLIRCYDNGGVSLDRYTVVFTGNYRDSTGQQYMYVSMNHQPTHPQGVCMHGGSFNPIDRPKYSHLGKRVTFDALPKSVRDYVASDYEDLWGLRG